MHKYRRMPARPVVQPFKISAIKVLTGSGPLTALEIVEKAVQSGLLDAGKMTHAPERTMSAVLSNNIRQRGADSEFVRQDDRFGLNPALKHDAKRAAGRPAGVAPEPPEGKAGHNAHLRAMFNGKAGEYSVVSELLFHGFDACAVNVDDGTDVFAVKGNRCFFIQVKTSAPVRNKCAYLIPPGAHEKFNHPDAYYVFVRRSDECNDFVVMPYHEVQKHMDSGRITKSYQKHVDLGSTTKSHQKYCATLSWKDRITLGDEDVTYYRRRWPRA